MKINFIYKSEIIEEWVDYPFVPRVGDYVRCFDESRDRVITRVQHTRDYINIEVDHA